jgi:ABC-2 type transport system permease protein
MPLTILLRTALRVLTQIRHDRRTLGLMLVVPSVLLALLDYVFDGRPDVFDQIGLQLLGIFPYTSMFMVTSVAMLRERTSGTLERLLSTPMRKLDLLLGYGLAFAIVGIIQASVAAAVAYQLLGLESQGGIASVMSIVVATAVLGSSTGLLTSAFARTEYQAMQFMPWIVIPQLLVCGLVWPRANMSPFLQAFSDVVPLRYAAEALMEVATYPRPTTTMRIDLAVVIAFAVVSLLVGAATLRRRST